MSLSLVKVPVKKILCPEVDINREKVYVIAKGAKDNTYQRFQAQNLNASSITVTSNPPNRDIVVNRRAYVRASYQINFTGTPQTGSRLLVPGLDAPRQWGISRSINSCQVSLNNDQYTNVLNQYWNPMLRYHDPKKLVAGRYSSTPSYLDQYQEYDDYNTAGSFGAGSAKNALGSYGANSEDLRGGFAGLEIVSNAVNATTAQVNLTLCEPILVSPFIIDDNIELDGFTGLQNMSSTWSFGELSSALWSHNNSNAGSSTLSAISVTITAFEILLNFQSLPMDIPRNPTPIYDYFEIVPYSTPAVAIAAGASATITMNSVQLKTIPRRMYIYAAENANDMLFASGGVNKTDTYGACDALNITFNNKTGLLSTMSAQNIYQLSQENGCNLTWNQFTKYVGSVVCLDYSKDLSLNETEASGIIGNYQLGIQATIRNPRASGGRSVNYVLWCVVINEGVAQIVNGSMSHQVGVFNHEDVINAPIDRKLTFKKTQHVYGGDIYKTIGNIAKKVFPIVNTACEFVPGIEKAFGKYFPGEKAEKAKKGKKGKGILMDEGGNLMSRAELRDRMNY